MPVKTLTLYSRHDCHLCSRMLEDLGSNPAFRDVPVRVVEIDGKPELERRFGLRIPVLCAGEREICQYRLDVAALEAALARIDHEDGDNAGTNSD